jgi:hypothetical protein
MLQHRTNRIISIIHREKRGGGKEVLSSHKDKTMTKPLLDATTTTNTRNNLHITNLSPIQTHNMIRI